MKNSDNYFAKMNLRWTSTVSSHTFGFNEEEGKKTEEEMWLISRGVGFSASLGNFPSRGHPHMPLL